jgi:hypothetical protein
VKNVTEFLFLALFALLAVGTVGYYVYAKRRSRRERIAEILSGSNLLSKWAYSPHEWRKAADEEFSWIKNKDSGGEVYISPTTIYIKNDYEDRLIDLSDDGRVVTHASYLGSDMSPLKLRLRRKEVRRHPDPGRSDEVKYYKEDYRLPVPLAYREDAERVVAFFMARLQNNLEAHTAVVPDDEPISLFGKDPF